jgi:hypothetical protein
MDDAEDIDPRQKQIEELLQSLPEPKPPSEEFVARLRSEFAAGTIRPGPFATDSEEKPWLEDDRRDEASATPDAPPAEAASGGEIPGPEARPRVVRFPWRFVFPVAAAAAILLVVFVLNRGSGPGNITAQGNGTIHIGDETFPFSEAEEFTHRLQPGTKFAVEGDMSALLDLLYPGNLAVQATPGVTMTVPQPPGRWFGRTSKFQIDRGEVRVVTGPDFAGSLLRIRTPGTSVEVLGTTLAVLCDPCSTCVCVLDGTARMKDRSGEMVRVPPGMRNTIFNELDQPLIKEPIRPSERMKLQMLQQSSKSGLTGKPPTPDP